MSKGRSGRHFKNIFLFLFPVQFLVNLGLPYTSKSELALLFTALAFFEWLLGEAGCTRRG